LLALLRNGQTLFPTSQQAESELNRQAPSSLQPEKTGYKQTSEAATITDLPPLYPKVSWKQLRESQDFLGNYAIYYQNFEFEKDMTKQKSGEASVSGKTWFAELNKRSEQEDYSLTEDFQKYYSSELSKRG
jgi:hypothetical protein